MESLDNNTVKVAGADRVLLKVTILDSTWVNVALADIVLFIVVIRRTNDGVKVNTAESVTNFDFSVERATELARDTERVR